MIKGREAGKDDTVPNVERNGPRYSKPQYNVNAFFDESLSASAKFYSRNTAKKEARSADTYKTKGQKTSTRRPTEKSTRALGT